MLRVNNPLLGPTDGGFESGEEKAEKNKNAELKMTIWTIFLKAFFSTQGQLRGSLFTGIRKHRSLLGLKFLSLYYLFLNSYA